MQRRRELPTRLTQAVQLLIQNRVISNVLQATANAAAALAGPHARALFRSCNGFPRARSGWASGQSISGRFDIKADGNKSSARVSLRASV